MVSITHIGVWTRYANERTEAALRMIRHVQGVRRFSEGFIAVLDQPVPLKVSSDIINAVTKFVFVDNVGEYSEGDQLPA